MLQVKVNIGCVSRDVEMGKGSYFECEFSFTEQYENIIEAKKALKEEWRVYKYEYDRDKQTAEFWLY